MGSPLQQPRSLCGECVRDVLSQWCPVREGHESPTQPEHVADILLDVDTTEVIPMVASACT